MRPGEAYADSLLPNEYVFCLQTGGKQRLMDPSYGLPHPAALHGKNLCDKGLVNLTAHAAASLDMGEYMCTGMIMTTFSQTSVCQSRYCKINCTAALHELSFGGAAPFRHDLTINSATMVIGAQTWLTSKSCTEVKLLQRTKRMPWVQYTSQIARTNLGQSLAPLIHMYTR